MLNSIGQLPTDSSSSNNNNNNNNEPNLSNIASNIPLPPGSPPPTPNYADMQSHQQQHQLLQHQQQHQQQQDQHQHQHQHQHHQQQQNQHQHQQQNQHQQQPTFQPQNPLQFYRPQVFGSIKQPMTFAGIARRADDVVAETLSQYGPGMAIPTIGQHNVPTYPNMMPHMSVNQNLSQPLHYNHYTQSPMLPRTNPILLTAQPPIYSLNPRISTHQANTNLTNPTANARAPSAFATTPLATASFQQPTPLIVNRSNASVNIMHHLPSSTSSNNIVCNPTTSTSERPKTPISPPLDALKSQKDSSSAGDIQPTTESSSPAEVPSSSSSPSTFNILEDVKKRCETMVMNQVLEEHRHLKHKLFEEQKRRETLETEIFDLRRTLPGQGNLETHPAFIRKKQQEKQADSNCKDYNEAIKYVTSILSSKYQHTVQDTEMRQPLQGPKRNPSTRAKMSTAAPPPSVIKDRPEDERFLLDLEDGQLWCKYCDIHFKTLREFCDHLHKRDHHNQVGSLPRPPPWRESANPPPRLDKSRTYWKFKSLCSNVGNKLRMSFKVQDIDEVMYPLSKNRERMKMMNIDRDRGRFDKADRLFGLKGFDHLVPISGFYCKLCHTTMCDTNEVEEHIRLYTHNYEHAKFVALSAASERKFRTDLEKSYNSQNEELETRNHSTANKNKQPPAKVRDPSIPRPSSTLPTPHITPATRSANAANEVSQYSARLPYKKPTSSIVDNHEVIIEKFDKQKEQKPEDSKHNEPKQPEKQTREPDREKHAGNDNKRDAETSSSRRGESHQSTSRSSSSKPKDPSTKRKLPDIVPISKSSSGALKKLRHENKPDEVVTDESQVQKPDSVAAIDDHETHARLSRDEDKSRMTTLNDEDDLATQAYCSSATEQGEDDVMLIKMVSCGDPDSPFPELELSVTGNVHKDALKSKQLKQRPKVVLNRLNLDDYKDLLMPTTELWTRVNQLITKKELKDTQIDLDENTQLTKRTFLKPTGELVPVDIDESSSEDKGDFDMNRLQDFFCDT